VGQARLWAKVSRADDIEKCWLWTADDVGRPGVINAAGRVRYALRLSDELTVALPSRRPVG